MHLLYSVVEKEFRGNILSIFMSRIVGVELEKLKYKHITLSSFSKMRVDLAAQVQ